MLEVGRIRARIEGDTADFEKKMAGAQRTFQVTAQKLDASAQQVANSLKKTYSERVVAANVAADKEIAAARRSMNERIRATQNSAEVAAVRRQFAQRADAAAAGAQREIQAAQRQYLAASAGLRPLITSTEKMATTTTLATSQISKLRTATVAVANAAAGANPIFAQTSAVIGAMAGTGGVIALAVAGIVALGFAYNRLTRDARQLKEEQEKLNAALERGGRDRAGLTAGAENAAASRALQRMAEITTRINELRTIPQFRTEFSGTEAITVARSQKEILAEITRLSQEYGKLSLVALEVDGKRAEAGAKVAEEAARAAESFDQLLESGREINRELDESLRKLIEIADEGALAFRQREALGPSPRGGIITRPSVIGSGPPRTAPLTAETELNRWVAGVRKAAAQSGDVLSDAVKKMFDPRQILSGLATGGLATLSGALIDFGAQMLGLSSKAREAAKAMREAQRSWSRTLDDFIRSFLPEGQQRQGDLVAQLQDYIQELFKSFFRVKQDDPRLGAFVTIKTMLDSVKDLPSLISTLQLLKQLFPEFADQIDKIIHGATLAADSLGKTAEAADKVSEALTNVPTGFKIALARFNATSPTIPGLATPGVGSPAAHPIRSGTTIVVQHVDVHGVEDLPSFVEKLEVEISRKQLRGGSGIALGYL